MVKFFSTIVVFSWYNPAMLVQVVPLKRGFKLLFGTLVFSYITSLRMNYATLLLKEGMIPVGEISFLPGYEYPQHFSAAYKKHTGISPSKLKK